MTHLSINQLSVAYGSQTVLNNINLDVQQGEMIALLGPSGCGKTTLLNTLCGFTSADSGKIMVAKRDITHRTPESRNITMVFQSYALWPHMTVEQNIGFGLKIRGYSADIIQQQVHHMLEAVNLPSIAHRLVTELSGGQRQRVALARALAVNPDVLLLDEPLSNLDAKVRLSVRDEIKHLQEKLGFTSIIVTHDQEEAQVMADRIAVLNQGVIEQLGTPQEIYHTPKTRFVADFMGADNAIALKDLTALGDTYLPQQGDGKTLLDTWKQEGTQDVYFRSEHTHILPQGNPIAAAGLALTGHVERSVFLGGGYQTMVRVNQWACHARSQCELAIGAPVTVVIEPHHLLTF
ncbi:MAG: ABC transporter ATP-binding protein [Vibrio sp.]